jgi:hypothetical protein
MFHGTYDRRQGQTAIEGSRSNMLSCRRQPPIHTLARIIFASPKIISPNPRVNCGHWSKRGSLRWPLAHPRQASGRSPTTSTNSEIEKSGSGPEG